MTSIKPWVAVCASFVVGSALFLAVFTWRLDRIPEANYKDRDDAIITLSHARNLVEYGFIGVSPSGERIEGFSAPLQFWTAAAVYAAVPFNYPAFLEWQTRIGTLLFGGLCGVLLMLGAPASYRHWLLALAGLIAAALILSASRAFLLWHGSGMENVYKSVTLVALVAVFDGLLRGHRWHALAIATVFLAGLSRIDAIVPVGMILGAFIVLWTLRYRSARGVAFGLVALAPWLLYMGWRWWYFGQWQPNTAIAQGISIGDRIALLTGTPAAAFSEYLDWTRAVGRSLFGFQFAWIPVLVAIAWKERLSLERGTLMIAGGLGCVVQFALFGPARMDPARTVTDLATFATLLAPFVVLARRELNWPRVAAAVLVLGVSTTVALRAAPDRDSVGWGPQWFEENADVALGVVRANDLPRPSFANPDLGAASWRKQFNMIDLGKLGSAVVPRIDQPGTYLAEFVKPDVIEIHGSWSCWNQDLFTSPEFAGEYVAVRAERTPWFAANCGEAPQAQDGIWIRRAVMKDSGSAERRFLDAFRQTFDLALVRQEISRCVQESGPRPCAYVGRTLVRFVPELKQAGKYEHAAGLLDRDPRLSVEHAYFVSSTEPRWWKTIIAAFHPIRFGTDRVTFFALTDGSRASSAAITLADPAELHWRLEVTEPLFDVSPSRGTAAAEITLVPRQMSGEVDRTVNVNAYPDGWTAPAAAFTVRFRSMKVRPPEPPTGSVDGPPDPIVFNGPVTFQGWALDGFDFRQVRAEYVDARGTAVTLGTARGSWRRPDVAALLPNMHDTLKSGWALTIGPRALDGVPRPVKLHFYAETGDGRRAEIGTRTVTNR